jgi:hypothetical protein
LYQATNDDVTARLHESQYLRPSHSINSSKSSDGTAGFQSSHQVFDTLVWLLTTNFEQTFLSLNSIQFGSHAFEESRVRESSLIRPSRHYGDTIVIDSEVFTASLYVVGIGDEQSTVSVQNAIVASVSAVFALLMILLIGVFLMRKHRRFAENNGDAMYETEANAIELSDSESESSQEEWDVEDFDRAMQSVFHPESAKAEVQADIADDLFPSDCDEMF